VKRVFISFSLERSRELALILRNWLPDVIQQVQPWVSHEDIEKGQRWAAEVSRHLDGSTEGLICVTPENQAKPWLNFEAGALAKSLDDTRVRPVLLGLKSTDVDGPLAQFQATNATDQKDMFRLIDSINSGCPQPLDPQRLVNAFARTWDDYFKRVCELEKAGPAAPRIRPAEDMTREVLDLVRSMSRAGSSKEQEQRFKSLRRRRIDPSEDVVVGGEPFVRAVSHRLLGPGVIIEALPDLRTADGSLVVLVDFGRSGPAVVNFGELSIQQGMRFEAGD
jgi:hypothetical protein